MALARPGYQRRRTSIEERPFSTLTWPHNGHQVSGLRQLDEPVGQHTVRCGLGPHATLGRAQLGIAAYHAARGDSQ